MGLLAFFANDAKSRELFEESIALARAAGDEWCLTDCLGTIGSIYPLQGEPEKGTGGWFGGARAGPACR